MPLSYPVELLVEPVGGAVESVSFDMRRLVMAGFTGRDQKAMQEYIDRKRAEGMTGWPAKGPSLVQVSRYLLTTADAIEVQGKTTAGQGECVVLRQGERLFVGVGSDHCDLGSMSVRYDDKPQQIGPRVLHGRVWRYEDVADHWDRLHLRSWVTKNGERLLYQDSDVSSQLPPFELFGLDPILREDGVVLYCGGIPELLDPVFEDEFEVELTDPVLNRALRHRYTIHPLSDDSEWRGY